MNETPEPYEIPALLVQPRRFRRPKQQVVAVTVVPLGEPELGEWCNRCLLPSGVRVSVALQFQGTPLTTMTSAQCMECGQVLE